MAKLSSKFTLILLVLILVGVFLRFYKLHTLTTYLTDQAIELSDTLSISRGDLKFVGIKTSISEARNGAVMYYLLLPFLYIFKFNPIAGGVLQGLLSVATIPLAYVIGKKARNELTGIIASGVIALSPLLVLYSRQTQLAYYPLFFSAAILLLLVNLLGKYQVKVAILLGLMLGFSLQIHYLTFTLTVLSFLSIVLFSKQSKKCLPILFAGFVAGLAPILLFELKNNFFNTRMFLKYFVDHAPVESRVNSLDYFQVLLSKLIGGNQPVLGLIVFLIAILLLLYRLKSKFTLTEKILLLHLGISLIVVFIFSGNLVAHYLLPSFVSLIVLLASSLVYSLEKYPKLVLPVALVGIYLIIVNFPAYRLSATNGADMSPGWNLEGVEKSAQIIVDDVGQNPYNVAMIVDAQNQAYPLRYLLDVAKKPPLSVENYDKATYLYAVIVPNLNLDSALDTIYELNSFGGRTIENKWEIQNGYKLYKFSKNKIVDNGL